MSAKDKFFFDTNVLLYLLSSDPIKADRAEDVVSQGGVISVQVLNEFAAVAHRKLGMTCLEIREALAPIGTVCELVPMVRQTHDLGLDIMERYGLSVWDAMIVAAANLAGCSTLSSEDMQHGQIIENVRVANPFR